MTDPKPSRRDLMKPAQLLGLAFAAAAFAGLITLMSMGIFQAERPVPEGDLAPHVKAWMVAGIVAGVVFIATLVIIALLLLAVDPAQLSQPLDRPKLLPPEDEDEDAADDTSHTATSDGSGGEKTPPESTD